MKRAARVARDRPPPEEKANRATKARARLPKDAPPANGPRAIGARQFGGPSAAPPPVPSPQVATEKPKRERAVKETVKLDPQLSAKARELRDRYLEQVNERLLIGPSGKYDVSRTLEGTGIARPRLAG